MGEDGLQGAGTPHGGDDPQPAGLGMMATSFSIDSPGAIAPHRLHFGENAPSGPELDTVLDERGAEEVAAEVLDAGTIATHRDLGVEAKPSS